VYVIAGFGDFGVAFVAWADCSPATLALGSTSLMLWLQISVMPKNRLTVSSQTRPNCNHILETAISPGGTAFDVLRLDATADASVKPLMCMPSSSQSDDKRSITVKSL
jgi:hypothetical protein